MIRFQYQFCFLFVIFLLPLTIAKVAKSDTEQIWPETFRFLTRFAFQKSSDSEIAGSIQVRVFSERNTQKILYYGSEEVWNEAYFDDEKTCAEKESLAVFADLIDNKTDDNLYFLGRMREIRYAPRQNYWFVAVSNCDGEDIQLNSFFIQFLQGDNSQFSIDEKGIVIIYALFFVFYSTLCSINAYAMYIIAETTRIHTLFKLLSAALFFDYVGLIFDLIDQAIYKNNGIGLIGLKYTGDTLIVVSHLFLLLLLLLIAKGWTISTEEIQGKKAFFILFGSYSVIYVTVFAVQVVRYDQASLKSEYESAYGIVLFLLRCLSFLYFLYCLRKTYRVEHIQKNRGFYRRFGFSFSVWFLIFPISMFIIASVDATNRDKIVVAVATTINAFALSMMAYLLWPSRTFKYFKIINLPEHPSTNTHEESEGANEVLPYGSI